VGSNIFSKKQTNNNNNNSSVIDIIKNIYPIFHTSILHDNLRYKITYYYRSYMHFIRSEIEFGLIGWNRKQLGVLDKIENLSISYEL